jgi:small subunit ribosomal protein S20
LGNPSISSYNHEEVLQMPNVKSAKKRVKVIRTKTALNKARKSNMKTVIKKADQACVANAADKEAAIRVAIKRVDQACAKGLLHKNAAARKKSQLMKKLNAAG